MQSRTPAILGATVVVWSGWFAATLALAQIPKPTDAPSPLTPEQSAAAFKLPKGFRMEVVASEPLIASPSAVCWDEHGRMFVSELHGYNLAGQLDIEELNQAGKLDTQVRRVQAAEKFKDAAKAGTFGVVKLLRDTNGDGLHAKTIRQLERRRALRRGKGFGRVGRLRNLRESEFGGEQCGPRECHRFQEGSVGRRRMH